MSQLIINAVCYFDGRTYRNDGPYRLLLGDGVLVSIQSGSAALSELPVEYRRADSLDAKFLMPGLVEAHCHLFLNGDEEDLQARSDYLKAPLENKLQTARLNVEACLASGITLIRDAGDRYGVNHAIRDECSARACGTVIRSPGFALRQPKKYGAFMAKEVSSQQEIRSAVAEAARRADDLKILQTGIIDFEAPNE